MTAFAAEFIVSPYPLAVLRWFEGHGIPIHRWRYKEASYGFPREQEWIGPMAQDVQAKFPELVTTCNGHLHINLLTVEAATGARFTDEIGAIRKSDLTTTR